MVRDSTVRTLGLLGVVATCAYVEWLFAIRQQRSVPRTAELLKQNVDLYEQHFRRNEQLHSQQLANAAAASASSSSPGPAAPTVKK